MRDAALGALVLGLLAAVAWARLAPDVVAVAVEGGGARLEAAETAELFTRQAVLAGCLAVAGLLLAVAVVLRARPLRPDVPAVLTLAGLAGAVLAWQVGERLGPPRPDLAPAGPPAGTSVVVPLDLDAPGVLVLWPVASLLVVLVVGALRRERA